MASLHLAHHAARLSLTGPGHASRHGALRSIRSPTGAGAMAARASPGVAPASSAVGYSSLFRARRIGSNRSNPANARASTALDDCYMSVSRRRSEPSIGKQGRRGFSGSVVGELVRANRVDIGEERRGLHMTLSLGQQLRSVAGRPLHPIDTAGQDQFIDCHVS